MKIGIIFGGRSREREISFAGGRTVYDCLDKSLFEAVPLFIDSLGKLIRLDWQHLYKGSIRDFYPPQHFHPEDPNGFQIYPENIAGLSEEDHRKMAERCGKPLSFEELPNIIDFAFLTLHGPYGEDGTIQGMLQFLNIPYTSAGIFPSAFAMDKSLQKSWMPALGFDTPAGTTLNRKQWETTAPETVLKSLKYNPGFPFVIKSATQGSSIGVSIQKEYDPLSFGARVNKSFFKETINAEYWKNLSGPEKISKVQQVNNVDEGIGMPVTANHTTTIYHPADLLDFINSHFQNSDKDIILDSIQTESKVVFEKVINGREFSCIVIQQEDGTPLALPPTEIRKKTDLFDYRAKYLPGISRKVTPIDLPNKEIQKIRIKCMELFDAMQCNVYARIDGFITKEGTVYLNDPNTTSGMLPSSFFFHQAAEIGLNPGQFLTYIIRQSLVEREKYFPMPANVKQLKSNLDKRIHSGKKEKQKSTRVAVILGGYSTERHISVESGRNVHEKLSASPDYDPFPVFLTLDKGRPVLYKIPVNLLLKDNADDISEKINSLSIHTLSREIIEEAEDIRKQFGEKDYDFFPEEISIKELADEADFAFLALHGRPGEDGTLQEELLRAGLPCNGSPPATAALTIDKYKTNHFLKDKGFLTPDSILINKSDWKQDPESIVQTVASQISFPCIAKPSDDGCSSAVIKINNEANFRNYAEASFRSSEELSPEQMSKLNIDPTEPFPKRDYFMAEALVKPEASDHFLEITGGMLTHPGPDGEIEYEVFEPSEALAEEGILSLEEKFLAGEGQNITPARFANDPQENKKISEKVKSILKSTAEALSIEGYCRIDAFVRIYKNKDPEVIFIEVNSLPGLTPATCIFHQAALSGYKPVQFLDNIIRYGLTKKQNIGPDKISEK